VVEAEDILAAKAKARPIVLAWYEANPLSCGFIFLCDRAEVSLI
jgi:hypothetical protein